MKNRSTVLIITAIILVLLMLVVSFFKWQYKILAPCRFVAQQEWSLVEIEPGKVIARLISNNPYQVNDFHLLQFDRNDFVQFVIADSIKSNKFIKKGTVVGRLSSSENQIRLNILLGQLESAKADFQTFASGSKPEIQEEVKRELEYAKAAFNRFEPQLQRQRELYKQELISYEELEQAETQYQLLELNMAVAEAKLKAVQSGEKTEVLNIHKTEIQALEKQIEALKLKLEAEQIITPIRGMVMDSYGTTNLCLIAKLDTMIAQIPVEENKIQFINKGDVVRIKIPGLSNQILSGLVIDIGKNAQLINGSMKFIVSTSIKNTEKSLLSGMTGYSKILCDKISTWQLLRRLWQTAWGGRIIY